MKKYTINVICSLAISCIFFISFAFADTVKVVSFTGDVEITPSGEAKSVKPELNMPVKTGTRIVTGKKSYLNMVFDEEKKNVVKVGENSDVVIKLEKENKIQLVDGDLYVLLEKLPAESVFEVETPCAVCGVRGTGWHTKGTKKFTDVTVFNGKVFVQGKNKDGSVMDEKFWVKEGYKVRTKKHKSPGKMTKVSRTLLNKLKNQFKNNKKRDRKGSDKFDDRREGIIERKDEGRIDKIRDKLDEKKESGGHYLEI